MKQDVRGHLRQSAYFKALSDANLEALARTGGAEDVAKGDYLFHEGWKGRAVFLLASGGIQLLKSSAGGQEVVVKTVSPGEVFAEVILFERDAYPVSALAVKPSVVCRLPKQGFLALLDDRGFRSDFIAGLMSRMRYLADRILYLTAYDVEVRFFRFLEEQYGRKERYAVALSKKHVAAAIGTIPETFSRLLARLAEEGKIQWKNGKTLQVSARVWDRQA